MRTCSVVIVYINPRPHPLHPAVRGHNFVADSLLPPNCSFFFLNPYLRTLPRMPDEKRKREKLRHKARKEKRRAKRRAWKAEIRQMKEAISQLTLRIEEHTEILRQQSAFFSNNVATFTNPSTALQRVTNPHMTTTVSPRTSAPTGREAPPIYEFPPRRGSAVQYLRDNEHRFKDFGMHSIEEMRIFINTVGGVMNSRSVLY